jgi:F0F1-type ATP synthase assembly protein I
VKPLVWMAGSSIGSWLALSAAAPDLNPELLLGMAGPLTSASVTWIVVERTHRAAPERVMAALMAGFGAKMLLFAAYVIAMMTVLGLRPVPFAMAFAGYFIVLHLMEGLFLKRLLASGLRSAARS